MELEYKPDFECAKSHWEAFWAKEALDRPLVCVTSPMDGMRREPYFNAPADSMRTCLTGEYEPYLKKFDAWARSTYFGGEAIPHFEVTLGPDQFAGFLGGKIIAPPEHLTTWVAPCVQDWQDFPVVLHDEPGSYLDRIVDYIRYATRYSEGKFLIDMLDLHSNIDAMSALRGPQGLCFDLMDRPDEIERVLSEVRRIYPMIHDAVFRAGDMECRGSIGWAPTYAKGRFAVVQCDFSCMISPEQARRFVVPAIAEEAAYLDHCVYHYDGKEALGHLDDILAIPEIDVIQWVPGDGNPRSIEWMDLLHRMQKAGKGLWIYDWTIDEIGTRFKELRPEGLVFQVIADSQSQADHLLAELKRKM
jgi:hypothetical protein